MIDDDKIHQIFMFVVFSILFVLIVAAFTSYLT